MPQIESKILEIRDSGTFIAVLAIRMLAANPAQAYYFRRCGYPEDGSSIMLMCLYDGKATNDPYEWPSLLRICRELMPSWFILENVGARAMGTAHDWIINHYAELSDGDVVDVQMILGEHARAKTSERYEVSV